MSAVAIPAADAPVAVRLASRVRTLATATVLGQGAVLVTTPLLTRWFTPEEIGAFAAFSAVQSVLTVTACLRNDYAIPMAADIATVRGLVRRCVRSAALMSAATLIGAVGFRSIAEERLGMHVPWFPLLLALAVGLDGLRQAAWAAQLWLQDVGVVARSRALLGIEQAGLHVGAGVAGMGAFGLTFAYAVSRGAGLIRMWRRWPPAREERIPTGTHPANPSAGFTGYLTAAGVLNAIALQAPVLLLGGVYGPTIAAGLLLSSRVVGLPMTLLGQAVGQAYLAELGARNGRTPSVRQLRARMMRLGAVAFALLTPVMLLGPTVAPLVFGDAWVDVGRFAAALAPGAALQLAVSPFAQTLLNAGRFRLQFTWDLVRVGGLVAAVVVSSALGWSPMVSVLVISAVFVSTYGWLGVLILRASQAQAPSSRS